MLKRLARYFRRRTLAAAVGSVPALLARGFGFNDRYYHGQVQRVVRELKIDPVVAAYALAACCDETEFHLSKLSAGKNYTDLRAELRMLFKIETANFTCEDLRALRNVPMSRTHFYESGLGGGGD